MENRNYNEFSMRELFFFLKKKLWIVVVLALVGSVGGYIYGRFMVSPVYVADSQIYVYQQGEQNDGMNYNGLLVATYLRRDCEILITGKSVTSEVISKLGLRTTPAALGNNLKVTAVENTRVLTISCRDSDPEQAARILNVVCEIAAEQLHQLMRDSTVTVLYPAEVPTAPSSQGARHYATVGGVGGLVVALVLLVMSFLVDDTIHSEVDVER